MGIFSFIIQKMNLLFYSSSI